MQAQYDLNQWVVRKCAAFGMKSCATPHAKGLLGIVFAG
jgi:hypothetical protein